MQRWVSAYYRPSTHVATNQLDRDQSGTAILMLYLRNEAT
jgi:hypothetical protein